MGDRRYGYGWWVGDFGQYETCFAWGYGGQYIFVVPDLDLVIVATSSTDVSDERRGYRQALLDIVAEMVVPAVTGRRDTETQRKTN
jgi:CubicO group peptidase (beta-lactamase class C family)